MKLNTKKVDNFGIVAAGIADLVLVCSALFLIATGILEKIGFVIIGIVIVLFAIRGWMHGTRTGKTLWAIFALVSVFLDMSFTLVITDLQSTADGKDSYLEELKTEKKRLIDIETDLNAQYEKASKRDTMDQLDARLNANKNDIDRQNNLIQKREEQIQSGEAMRVDSTRLATATYDALISGRPGRVILFFLFLLVFVGVQLTMIVSINSGKKAENTQPTKKVKVKTKEGTKEIDVPTTIKQQPIRRGDPITQFVRLTWSYYRQGRSAKAQPKQVFLKLRAPIGGFDEVLYDKLRGLVEEKGYISKDGLIVEADEEKVIAWLSRATEEKR
jgi:hypothetical protein